MTGRHDSSCTHRSATGQLFSAAIATTHTSSRIASELEGSWQHAVEMQILRMIRSHEHADPSHLNHDWPSSCLDGEARTCPVVT